MCILQALSEGYVAVRRLSRFLLIPELNEIVQKTDDPRTAIHFDHAELRYGVMAVMVMVMVMVMVFRWGPDSIKPVLSDVTLTIAPGSLVAVVGPVGSGVSPSYVPLSDDGDGDGDRIIFFLIEIFIVIIDPWMPSFVK